MATHTDPVGEAKPSAGLKRLQCVVVTPEKTLIDEFVDFVALPVYDGELGVLPGHSPLTARLGYGELRTRQAQEVSRYYVDGGFAQVRDDVVTVLTYRAVDAASVDPVAASRDLERAVGIRAVSDHDFAAKRKAITRARAMLRVSHHRG
jgi:F-type H+-transporting ATPase subunit epsilon